MRRFFIAAALFACASVSWANDIVGRGLELKVGVVNPATLPNLLPSATAFDAGQAYVLELDGPMTRARRADLAVAGVEVLDYLPHHAYVVRLGAADPAALRALPFVIWVGAFEPGWKIDPQLGLRPFSTEERSALSDAGMVRIAISLFPGSASAELVAELNRAGATINSLDRLGSQWIVEAETTFAHALTLADLPTVEFIEDAPELTLRNDSNRWIVQSNVNPQTPVWNAGIHGEGQVAGLIDTPMQESHCMFDDTVPPGPTHRKIVAYNGSSGSSSHGTHVAGTLAGDSAPYGVYNLNDGMAFAAKIAFTNSGTINSGNLYNSFVTLKNAGARVFSNSWGDDGTTAYTAWCRAIDEFSYDFEDNLVAFAVTNTSSLRTPENSTNVLAVGASGDTPNQGTHCSGGVGPTSDGRRKPEVYAPGCSTTSAWAGTTCSFTNMTGTSMACPAVAGAAVLVRQYFMDGYYPTGAASAADVFTPSGALIRATLMNSAVDMTGISGYPSNLEGWGRVLLDNALFFPGDARSLYVEDVRNAGGLATGETAVYTFSVTDSAQPLRITMTFTQPPASVNASNAAINDLDLEVESPSGTTYRGNVISGGNSSPGGAPDTENNTEMYIASAPSVGDYTVTIRGAAVNMNLQGYALAVSGAIQPCPQLLGDVDGNCHVNLADLSQLLSAFGACDGDGAYITGADFDQSGCIDLADLAALLGNFGH